MSKISACKVKLKLYFDTCQIDTITFNIFINVYWQFIFYKLTLFNNIAIYLQLISDAIWRLIINIDKNMIIVEVTTQLQQELALALEAANNAHKAATDDQSVAETQYDTLAIEQSYLAEGQSRRVDEIKYAIKNLTDFPWKLSQGKSQVVVGSLVQMEKDLAKQHWYFIAPAAGGYRCKFAQDKVMVNITVITPHSPMGAALLGKEFDDEVILTVGNNKMADYIIAIE